MADPANTELKTRVLAFVRSLPDYDKFNQNMLRSLSDYNYDKFNQYTSDYNKSNHDTRYQNITYRLIRGLQKLDNNLMTPEMLENTLSIARQEYTRFQLEDEQVSARERTLQFIQELLNNNSHRTMVDRLTSEIARLDRGIIPMEVLEQILQRAERAYVGTLDNI